MSQFPPLDHLSLSPGSVVWSVARAASFVIRSSSELVGPTMLSPSALIALGDADVER